MLVVSATISRGAPTPENHNYQEAWTIRQPEDQILPGAPLVHQLYTRAGR
jgi:hypothetical protein